MADIPAPEADAPQKEVITVPDNEEPIVSIYTDPEMQGSKVQIFIKRAAFPSSWPTPWPVRRSTSSRRTSPRWRTAVCRRSPCSPMPRSSAPEWPRVTSSESSPRSTPRLSLSLRRMEKSTADSRRSTPKWNACAATDSPRANSNAPRKTCCAASNDPTPTETTATTVRSSRPI